jgi:hypothetical protein
MLGYAKREHDGVTLSPFILTFVMIFWALLLFS